MQRVTTQRTSSARARNGWSKPEQGYVKCNYDCSYHQDGVESNVGWIIRDATGTFIEAVQSKGRLCDSVLEAELQGLLMAMQHSWARGHRNIIFEGDNKMVVNLIYGKTRSFDLHNLVQEVHHWQKKFTEAIVKWTSRTCNKVADSLATMTIPNNNSFHSHCYVPSFLVKLLHEDYTSIKPQY